jgi:predicted AAA+ superfamily ATPase
MYNRFTMGQNLQRALGKWCPLGDRLKLNDPMTFLTGARQVGKTFLARQSGGAYFNWDTPETKSAYAKDKLFFRGRGKTVIFDEIHKRQDWKRLIKGYYDSTERRENFIVTGSGRFDRYQRGGDSLQGRYFSYRLWPLVVDELRGGKKPALARNWASWEPGQRRFNDEDLLLLGGFPAPFLSGRKQYINRWNSQYLDRLVREDVRDFSMVKRLDQMELLARLLPNRVCSPLSYQGLAEDVEVSPVAIKSWLRVFETLYLGFLVKPYHRRINRAVKREPKWYFENWSMVEDNGGRFENYVAVQLSAACSSWSEQGMGQFELFYLRDQDRREVDFLITRELKPVVLIEAKSAETGFTPALKYYTRKLKVPGFMVYPVGRNFLSEDGWCVNSGSFFSGMILQ